MYEAANRAIWLTGGDDGLQGITIAPLFGMFRFDLFGRTAYLYSLGVLFIWFLIAWRVVHSPFGRSLDGIRQKPARMRAIGTPVWKRLVAAYTLSAAIAGSAGALSAQTTKFVGLDTLGIFLSGIVAVMLVLGGVRRIYGAFLGAVVYVVVQDYRRQGEPVLLDVLHRRLAHDDRAVPRGRAHQPRRFLQQVPEAAVRAPQDAMNAPEPVLSVRGLSKAFGALRAVQDVDLDLPAGARHALIGPNGAGKTTLVNLLTGMIKADAGTIRLGGETIGKLKPEDRVRRGIARTHQINTLLIEETARDNVAIAIAERERIAWRTLRYTKDWRRCLDEADARLREIGILDVAGRRVSELAYGQQRLLEIAIALALKPRVLLLDEPAAGVPAHEAHIIHEVLERLPADIAILIIEHDMDVVFRFARHIIVMVQGKVLVRGEPAEIAANPQVREVYLGRSAV